MKALWRSERAFFCLKNGGKSNYVVDIPFIRLKQVLL